MNLLCRNEFLNGQNNSNRYSILAGYFEWYYNSFNSSYSNLNDQNFSSIELYVQKKELEYLKELLGNPGVEFFEKQWINPEFIIQIKVN